MGMYIENFMRKSLCLEGRSCRGGVSVEETGRGMSEFLQKWLTLGQNVESIIRTHRAKVYWNLIRKSPGFVSFGPNLLPYELPEVRTRARAWLKIRTLNQQDGRLGVITRTLGIVTALCLSIECKEEIKPSIQQNVQISAGYLHKHLSLHSHPNCRVQEEDLQVVKQGC